MTPNTCLLLKPRPKQAQSIVDQMNAIKDFIKPAIEMAELELLVDGEDDKDGTFVEDITPGLVQLALGAWIVVVDANLYEESAFSFAPYLCYFIGMRHSFGNRTFLVAKSVAHLPPQFQREHTLRYGNVNSLQFVNSFKKLIGKLRLGAEEQPDNPIQEYLVARRTQDALAQAQTELERKTEAIEQKQEQILSQPPAITFRRVSK